MSWLSEWSRVNGEGRVNHCMAYGGSAESMVFGNGCVLRKSVCFVVARAYGFVYSSLV